MSEQAIDEITERPDRPELVKQRPPTLDQYIIERFRFDPEWEHSSWKKVNMDQSGNCKFVHVEGAVYKTKIARGPRKGATNYKKPELGTHANVSILTDEMDSWIAKWEAETGYCSKCEGTGYAWAGWSATRGNRYRECKRCSSGKKLAA